MGFGSPGDTSGRVSENGHPFDFHLGWAFSVGLSKSKLNFRFSSWFPFKPPNKGTLEKRTEPHKPFPKGYRPNRAAFCELLKLGVGPFGQGKPFRKSLPKGIWSTCKGDLQTRTPHFSTTKILERILESYTAWKYG